MPYRLTTFDNIPLPDARPIDDLSAAPAESTLANSVNDAFDYWGTDRRLPRIQQIEMTGMYVGQTPYLVDELGNFIVDELGDNIVVGGDYITSLRNQTDDLKRKIGRVGYLVRKREDDSTLQQKTARLLKAKQKGTVDDVKRVANVEILWETRDPAWRDQALTTASVSYTAGANVLTCTIDGTEDITDAIIRVTATTDTSTVRVVYAGVDWTYTSTITAGNVLVIDTGRLTVKNNGVGDYTHFDLPTNQSKQSWLYLANGSNIISITITSGTGTFSVEWNNQWA